MPLAWVTILIPEREREREREREKEKEEEEKGERVVAFLFYAFNSILSLLGSSIFCQTGQFYH